MTSTPHAGDLPEPRDRELDDLITSHLDGGLDAAGQRRLAALLAATPAARATLARYLRLESALVRLARVGGVGDVGGRIATAAPAAPLPRVVAAPAVRPAWRSRRAAITLAGGAVAAAVALLVIGRPDPPTGRSADIAAVAEQWIDLRAAEAADMPRAAAERMAAEIDAVAAPEGVEPDWAEGDAAEPDRGSPPSWLVAAMVDDDNV